MVFPKPTMSSSTHPILWKQASRCGSLKSQQTRPNQPMHQNNPSRPGLGFRTAFLGALVLAGCAVGPDYQRPPPSAVPAAWKAGSPWKEGQPRDAEIKQNFWEIFDDPVLTGLEQEATTNSPDLRAAFERVEQSRAVARISRADLMPALSFDPNGNRAHYSESVSAGLKMW